MVRLTKEKIHRSPRKKRHLRKKTIIRFDCRSNNEIRFEIENLLSSFGLDRQTQGERRILSREIRCLTFRSRSDHEETEFAENFILTKEKKNVAMINREKLHHL